MKSQEMADTSVSPVSFPGPTVPNLQSPQPESEGFIYHQEMVRLNLGDKSDTPGVIAHQEPSYVLGPIHPPNSQEVGVAIYGGANARQNIGLASSSRRPDGMKGMITRQAQDAQKDGSCDQRLPRMCISSLGRR